MLGHSFMEGLFSFTSVQFIAFLLALYGIDDIALFVSWCFVVRLTSFCLKGVGGFELHWDIVFWRILLNFSKTPDRYGIEMLLLTSLKLMKPFGKSSCTQRSFLG